MISGAFAIIAQSQVLGCFPRVRVTHTSKKYHGQVYIPEINYALMILCVAVTAIFQTTDKIGNAYGKKNPQLYIKKVVNYSLPEDNFCYKIEISHASIIPLHNCFMQLLLNSLHLKFQYKHRCTEVAHNIMCSLIYLPRLSASSPLLANMLYCHCCLSCQIQKE
uniref:K+ potassium transporter integral membrane domain-containing protein n=1 Tax=Aegilops tauschii subsp. strangulata TaxID=200361 RepID=A0A453GFA4_AEGTS